MDTQGLIANLKAIPIENNARDVKVHQLLAIKALLRWIDDYEVNELVGDIFEREL